MNLKEKNEFIKKFYRAHCASYTANIGQYEKCNDFFEKYCMVELDRKGHDYSHGGKADANRNFREPAKILGVSVYVVWGVYFFKHIDAIMGWLRGNEFQGEGIRSRVTDAVNYLLILAGIIEEDCKWEFRTKRVIGKFVKELLLFGCACDGDELTRSVLMGSPGKIGHDEALALAAWFNIDNIAEHEIKTYQEVLGLYADTILAIVRMM